MATNDVGSNYFSVSSYTNKGMMGMISGMDTESMVKQMLSGTQSKIDKQNALKQQTLWRQEYYRDIITSINGVRDKYFNSAFDASAANNLASSKFYNSMISAVTSGGAAKVVSTAPGAAIGDMRITVNNLASAASLSSGRAVGAMDRITAGSEFTAAMAESFDKSIALKIGGGNTVKIDLNGVTDQQEMLDRINSALSAEGSGAYAKIFENKMRIITDDPAENILVVGTSTSLGLQMTGLSTSASSSVMQTEPGRMLQGGNIVNPSAGVTMTVNLDGVDKQITLNPEAEDDPASADYGKITVEAVRESLQTELNRAFGNYIDVSLTANGTQQFMELKLNYAAGEAGHSLTVYGSEATRLGISPGASSRLTTSSKLGELTGIEGERFSFNLNGKDFTFSREDTIGNMINKINSSNVGVQMSYSSLSNTFKLTATASGSNNDIEINQTEGNLLGAIFQQANGSSMFETGSAAASSLLTVDHVQGNAVDNSNATVTPGGQFRFNVNGAEYLFTLADRDISLYGEYDMEEVTDELNYWLGATFGQNANSVQNIEFNAATGELNVAEGFLVRFNATAIDVNNASALSAAKKTDVALALGLNTSAKSNIADAQTALRDVYQLMDRTDPANPVPQAFLSGFSAGGGAADPDTKLGELTGYAGSLAGIGNVSFAGGRLSITAEDNDPNTAGGTANTVDISALSSLFGGVSQLAESGGGLASGASVAAGQDAQLVINGVTTTRSSNTFEIDGVTLQLTGLSNGTETVINTQRDTESIVSSVKSFIEEYNAMIDKLNGYVNAEPDYRDYAPLTTEQKNDMSDREVELWEERAKTGLLRRDPDVTTYLDSLQSTLYVRPVSSSYALYDIGIEALDYKQPGRLFFDETVFREALSADPGAVEALFLDSVNGVATRMGAIMDRAARVSSSRPGTLVSMAGVSGSYTDRTSAISAELTRINDRLSDLQTKYERERLRYWNQFNAMETVMSQYQSQMSYLSQMFTSGE